MQVLLAMLILGAGALVCVALYIEGRRRRRRRGEACVAAGLQGSQPQEKDLYAPAPAENMVTAPGDEALRLIQETEEAGQGHAISDLGTPSPEGETCQRVEALAQNLPAAVVSQGEVTAPAGRDGVLGGEAQARISSQSLTQLTAEASRELVLVAPCGETRPQSAGQSQLSQEVERSMAAGPGLDALSLGVAGGYPPVPMPDAPPQRASADRIDLVKRGPRRSAAAHETEKLGARQQRRCQPKPEIVCWKRERQWIVAVQLAEDFLADPDLDVTQDGEPLTRDESREDCWHLRGARGHVSVRSRTSGPGDASAVGLGDQNCLLFKLGAGNQDQGRRVKYATYGSFLVVAPDGWRRDVDLCGAAPVEPEPVCIPSYTAHFFSLEKDRPNKIAFRGTDGAHRKLASNAPTFELTGNRLSDASEDIGPLFGGGPPSIRSASEEAWEDIGTIVVGEEGSGTGKWRTAFSPSAASARQELRLALATKEGGWYFARLYDRKDDLVESLDFRFATGLGEIRVAQPRPLPPEGGHGPVIVEFRHTNDCMVEAAETDGSALRIEREAGRTRVVIPASPGFDRTDWELECGSGSRVKMSVLVERIWWSVGQEHMLPAETDWSDKPLALQRDAFRATSDAVLYLRFPKLRWTDEVRVGFVEDKSQPFSLRVDSMHVSIPLREFGDAAETADRFCDAALRAWIKDKVPEGSGPVVVIRSEVPVAPASPTMPHSELWLETISAAKLASSLNLLSRRVRWPLRGVMERLYEARPKRHGQPKADVINFKEEALCAIALACESVQEGSAAAFWVPKRRREQAFRAADAFPATWQRMRRKCKASQRRRMPR